MKRLPALALASLLLAASIAPAHAVAPRAPMDAAEIGEALDRLSVLGTALFVAAHPDDENTALLAWLNHGRKVRTGYLSMTRGDGGQNLIGAEAGEALGVIRTQELLAARRIDGAEQFFTNAIDFGYSKTPEETLELWGREATLADVVWVIRTFRPDVIVTRFGTDGSGGHGHHTASAVLANEAFTAAADPKRFPEQLAYARPWQPKRIFWNTWRPDTSNRAADRPKLLTVDVGDYNARLGRSYSELAGQSRSMHKSQGFGAPERRGTLVNWLEPTGGEPASGDPFDGVDLSWNRIAGGAKVEAALAKARRAFDPTRPAALVPALLEVRAAMTGLDDPYVTLKRAELDEVIRSCAGLWLEAIASAPAATPGGEVRVQLAAINRSGTAMTLQRVDLPNATVRRGEAAFAPAALPFNQPVTATAVVPLQAGVATTQPYWLAAPGSKGRFGPSSPALVGFPDNAPALEARFEVQVGGQPLSFQVPVVYRWTDRVQGERYRLLEVGPPVSLRFDQEVVAFPAARPVDVRVIATAGRAPAEGTLRLTLPDGWSATPASAPLSLAADEEKAVTFRLTPGAAGAATIGAAFESGGRTYDRRRVAIDYEHIPVQALFPRAEMRVLRAELARVGERIAYVMGSGDAGPEALRQMGYAVTLLGDDELESADLARYDAVVVGVRAYNTRPRLRVLDARLDDYVAQGGTVVVQYQTTEEALQNKIGPLPFAISRDRVTVEEAPMTFVDARHPLLTTPNKIGPADFTGWVQERGLYFAGARDAKFDSVLVANDPGERPLGGGLVYARHGKGVFVYTGLAFFRQLPAGVPGAWRLFANLVSARGERDGRRGAARSGAPPASGSQASR